MVAFRTGQRVHVAAWDHMKKGIADWRDDELAPVGTLGTVEGDFVRFDSGDRWPVSGTHILKPVEDEKMDSTGLHSRHTIQSSTGTACPAASLFHKDRLEDTLRSLSIDELREVYTAVRRRLDVLKED